MATGPEGEDWSGMQGLTEPQRQRVLEFINNTIMADDVGDDDVRGEPVTHRPEP